MFLYYESFQEKMLKFQAWNRVRFQINADLVLYWSDRTKMKLIQ